MHGIAVLTGRRSGRSSSGHTDRDDEPFAHEEATDSHGMSPLERRCTRPLSVETGPGGKAGRASCSDWMFGSTAGQWFFMVVFGVLLNIFGTFAWWATPGTAEFPNENAYQAWWMSYMTLADVGTQTGLKATDPGICHTVTVVFSCLGFAYNLAIMGMVVDVIRNQLESWKRDKSRIFFAKKHVLLLGWSDKTLYLLHELIAADASSREVASQRRSRCCGCCSTRRKLRRSIVILANRTTHDMSQDVKTYLQSRFSNPQSKVGARSITYRSGDPADQGDLMKVAASAAEVILIMGGSGDSVAAGADEHVMQTLLALAALHLECRLSAENVFADMQHVSNIKVMGDIFPEATGIVARHAVNRMLVLRGLAPSVGFAFLELATFNSRAGNKIWVCGVPDELVGLPFSDICCLFPEAVVLGVKSGPLEKGILPHFHRKLLPHDRLVMIAANMENARKFEMQRPEPYDGSGMNIVQRTADLLTADGQLLLGPSAFGEKLIIMIGCPPDYADFLQIIDTNLSANSEVHILSERPKEKRDDDLRRFCGDPNASIDTGYCFQRIKVKHYFGPTTSPWGLKQLPLTQADTVFILSECFSQSDSAIRADSKNLTSVINLRGLLPKKQGAKKCKVVTELIHPKSNLVVEGNAAIRKHGSFVYSTALETGVFALATEDKPIYDVLLSILNVDVNNCTLALFAIGNFVRGNESLSFNDLYRRVWHYCGGVLIGWRRQQDHYPVINPTQGITTGFATPSKTESIEWQQDSRDELIVFCPLKSNSARPSPHTKASSASDEPSAGAEPLVVPPGCLTSPMASQNAG